MLRCMLVLAWPLALACMTCRSLTSQLAWGDDFMPTWLPVRFLLLLFAQFIALLLGRFRLLRESLIALLVGWLAWWLGLLLPTWTLARLL